MTPLTYYKLPHPLREGDLLYYDADAVSQALDVARRGAPLTRVALGSQSAPEAAEVQGLEGRLRRGLQARARAGWGRALWWILLGPALSLLWINFAPALALIFSPFPPLEALVASLGAISGGPLLAAAVGLVPLAWAWRRAAGHLGQARRWGRLARLAAGRRFAAAPLHREADPQVEAFAAASAPIVSKLRDQATRMTERGADSAAEMAHLAREAYRLAQRHRLAGVAGAYHDVYSRLDAAEQRLGRLDREGGVLAERKMTGETQRVRRQAASALAAFASSGPVRSRRLAPLGGFLAGLATLAGTLLLTGVFIVLPGQAVIVDPPGARLARLVPSGAPVTPAGAAEAARQVVRTEGFHWSWPRPFVERHAVTLGEQRLRLQAIVRQTGPDSYDVLFVEMRFRINDIERWAQLDSDGTGVDALGGRLSSVLQELLQQQRQEARQTLRQQTPSLADDPAQLGARADQLVEQRLEETVRAFVGALSESGATREAGVQVAREHQSRLVRGVPAALAGATPGE